MGHPKARELNDVQARTAAHLHGRLEASERRTVVGIVGTGVDEVGGVLKVLPRLHLRTYEGDVGECGGREGRCVGTAGIVVALEAVALGLVGNSCVADGQAILHIAGKTIVGIEVIVPTMIRHKVLAVDTSTEPFEGIIVAARHLNMAEPARMHRHP